MAGDHTTDDHDLIERLAAQVDVNEDRIRALQESAASAGGQVDSVAAQVTVNGRRIARLEERAEIDAAIITELQAEELLSRTHAAHLEEALTTSRRIGAAIGIVMAGTGLTEQEAFELLKRASQDTNRKVRVLADDVVLTGDIEVLRTR